MDPKKHSESRGWIEGFLRYIPGFRGYLERDYRHESDHMARSWMADRLQRSVRGLDDYMVNLVNAGQLDQMTQCERVKSKIDALINKMRGAVRGYSGFFDYVKVDEDLLDRVYEHDMALVKDVENLAANIGNLATQNNGAASADELVRRLDDLDRRFEKRGEMLRGVGE